MNQGGSDWSHIMPLFAIHKSLAFSMGIRCWGPKLFKVPVFQPWKHTNDHIFIPASAFFWDLLLEHILMLSPKLILHNLVMVQ